MSQSFPLGWILRLWRLVFFNFLYQDIFILLLAVAFFSFFIQSRFNISFIVDWRRVFSDGNSCDICIYPLEMIHYNVNLLHNHFLCSSLVQFIEVLALCNKQCKEDWILSSVPTLHKEWHGFTCSLNPDL